MLTNNFSWSAATIAEIYKERWQIELFFKCIKQQLKVKSFVGTSKNALLPQLWVALITYLLLSYLKFKSKFNWSLYTLCSILPTNLFHVEISGIDSIAHSMQRAITQNMSHSCPLVLADLDSYDDRYN